MLRVTGTSNLLASNVAWTVFEDTEQVVFGDYGDWTSVLTEQDTDTVLWVLFLEDLIAPDKVVGAPDENAKKNIDVIFEPLISRLRSNNMPVIVAFSTWRAEGLIGQTRQLSAWKKLGQQCRKKLYSLADSYQDLYIIPLDELFSEEGLNKCFDARNYYLSRCRLSGRGLKLLASISQKVLNSITGTAKKVLVLDCDNTLWGGVVSEVGLAGISLGSDGLGQAFSDFQKTVKQLAYQGVLLVVASKNNEDEVWDVFEKHPGMTIRKNDLVAWRVNWNDKVDNLLEIADELDLGVDSFVFWDDNPLERGKMRDALPQVLTPELPDDVAYWPSLLSSFEAFSQPSILKEDASKSRRYKQRSNFIRANKQAENKTDFLKEIEMQPVPISLAEETLLRAAQLCLKTNQFNLRTERHTVSVLRGMTENQNYEAFLVNLKDQFGDHGIVGLAIAQLEGECAFLDTFLMSCRVLGRHLETWMLHELVNRLKGRNCWWLLTEYRPTQKNVVVASFLDEHGFKPAKWKTMPAPCLAFRSHEQTDKVGQYYCADLMKLEIPHLGYFK